MYPMSFQSKIIRSLWKPTKIRGKPNW